MFIFAIFKSLPSMKPNFLYSVVELLLGKCSHISNLICDIKNLNSKNKNCFKKYLKNIFLHTLYLHNIKSNGQCIHVTSSGWYSYYYSCTMGYNKTSFSFNKIYGKTLDRIHIYMYICRSFFRLFQIEFKMLLTFV
jgi:hypothetical protein